MQVFIGLVVVILQYTGAGAARIGLLRIGPFVEKQPQMMQSTTEFGHIHIKDIKNSVRELLYQPSSMSFPMDFSLSMSMSLDYETPIPQITLQPSPTPTPYVETIVPGSIVPTKELPSDMPSVAVTLLNPSLSPSLSIPLTSSTSPSSSLATRTPGTLSGTGSDLQVATNGAQQEQGPTIERKARTAMLAILAVALAAVASAMVARKAYRKGKLSLDSESTITDVASQIPTPT